jgi:hypothetical protein
MSEVRDLLRANMRKDDLAKIDQRFSECLRILTAMRELDVTGDNWRRVDIDDARVFLAIPPSDLNTIDVMYLDLVTRPPRAVLPCALPP